MFTDDPNELTQVQEFKLKPEKINENTGPLEEILLNVMTDYFLWKLASKNKSS